jgi:hypothetical protein
MMSLYSKELDLMTMLNHNFVNFQQKIVVKIVKPNAKIFHVKSEEVYVRIENCVQPKLVLKLSPFLIMAKFMKHIAQFKVGIKSVLGVLPSLNQMICKH